jgi:hypothetical protein
MSYGPFQVTGPTFALGDLIQIKSSDLIFRLAVSPAGM